MNRLQKKCLIASGLVHGLLCVAMFVGSAFSTGKKQEETPVINVYEIQTVTDGRTTGGSPDGGAVPEPKKEPPVAEQKPEPPAPTPEPPKDVAKIKEPDPEPELELPKELPENVEPDINPEFAIKKKTENKIKLTPVQPKTKTTAKSQPQKLVLKQVVRNTNNTKATTKNVNSSTAATDRQNAALRELAKNIGSARGNIRNNTGTGVNIEPLGPGGGGPVSANYAQFVKAMYDEAWRDPQEVADENANVKTEIIIERSGNVISARIVSKSGIPALDKSVQSTLDRVRFVRAFPEAATERQRTYILNFNLKAKRLAG